MKFYCRCEIRLQPGSWVHVAGEDKAAEKGHSPLVALQPDFPWMQIKEALTREPFMDARHEGSEEVLALMDNHEIIDVAPVIAKTKLVLAEMVESVEVEVGENLRREVADRKTQAGGDSEQAFIAWQVVPEFHLTPTFAADKGIVQDKGATEGEDSLAVGVWIHAPQEAFQQVHEEGPADVHEKALDVELEHPGLAPVVRRALADKVQYPPDAEVRALSDAAGIAVIDKRFFKIGVEPVDEDVMDNAVSEACGKDFSFDGLFDDEYSGWAGLPRLRIQFLPQRDQVAFEINLKG